MSTGVFCTELADFLDEMLALPGEPLICGDFNCAGSSPEDIDLQLSDVLELRQLEQRVKESTHKGSMIRPAGNLLDLLITLEDSQLTSKVAVLDVGFSDNK